jgi:uncharacterized protein YbjT (DUF2867 family)
MKSGDCTVKGQHHQTKRSTVMAAEILITGATGNTGFPLVMHLASEGVPVRALIHSPSKKSLVEQKNVEIIVGDFAIAGLVERALEGISRAYLVSPESPDQIKYQINFVNSAKIMGIKHLVKLSALGTAPDSPVAVHRWHAEIEEHIRQSGINYTFLHPHFFMENLMSYSRSVIKEGALYSPLGETKVSMVSVEDIAVAAAVVLTDGGHVEKTYNLTGPEALNFAEIAGVLGEVIGKRIKYVHVPYQTAKAGMVKSGMPSWLAEDMVSLMQSWSNGKGSMVSNYVERLTGERPISFKEFFLKHRNRFRAAA